MTVDEPSALAAETRLRLKQADKIEAEGLARLFASATGRAGPHHRALLNTLHGFLLEATIDHARRATRFYGTTPAYAAWRALAPEQRPTLCGLPILDRHVINERFEDFLADDVETQLISHTSGNTGKAFELYRSFEEVQFIGEFLSSRTSEETEPEGLAPLVMTFPNAYHGVPVPAPVRAFILAAAVNEDIALRDAHRVLVARHHIPGFEGRVSAISGPAFHVMFFTNYLLEQGLNLRQLGVRSISITARYASRYWREILANAWGAKVLDKLSMTEIVGGAGRLAGGELFIADPYIFPEVADPDHDGEPADGIGTLLMTNFYPLAQNQPLIRYRTGDIIRCVRPTPFVFDYLGREGNCVRHPETGGWLLFSAKLDDILSPWPDIGRHDWGRNVSAVRDPTVGALPIMEVTTEPGPVTRLRISIELRYSPHMYPDRVDDLRRELVSKLREVSGSSLAGHMDSGAAELDVRFLAPGGLGERVNIDV